MAKKSSKTKVVNTASKISSPAKSQTNSYLSRIESELQSNQSRLNMVLGALIVLVIVILVFNYFNRGKSDLGPAQSTTNESMQEDLTPESLPGNYTVNDGDPLFPLAAKYYNDGYKYSEIASVNSITNVDSIEAGQVLDIPKLEAATATQAESVPSATPETSPDTTVMNTDQTVDLSTPVIAPVSTDTYWGEKITENTYTVQSGDWLSTIAGRAYGNIYEYQKIAEANKITDPNTIEVGTVLTLPR